MLPIGGLKNREARRARRVNRAILNGTRATLKRQILAPGQPRPSREQKPPRLAAPGVPLLSAGAVLWRVYMKPLSFSDRFGWDALDRGQTISPECTTTRDLNFVISAIALASSNTESRASSRSGTPVGDNSKTSKFAATVPCNSTRLMPRGMDYGV